MLLRGRIGYRRDTLLLTGKNCAFLGGENENFFRTGRPVNVMGAALEGKKSESSDRRPKIRYIRISITIFLHQFCCVEGFFFPFCETMTVLVQLFFLN